ncbi:MAG: sulfatase-like hydrolase/transferase [Acidobacteriota bacterium]
MKPRWLGAAIVVLAGVSVLIWWWQGCPPEFLRAGRGEAPRNLLVLTFDTTRADHLSIYGGPAEVPNLQRLARNGVRFENAFAPTPLTLPSHVSLFTGLYPVAHGVRNNGAFRLGDEARTLAEVLLESGFRTAAVVGTQVLHSRYGLDQGFELYDDLLPPEEKVDTLFVERPATAVADAGLAWLAGRGEERWFLWLHFFDPHYEYNPPEPYRSRYADSPYDGEIAYADAQAGRVLESLRGRGWLERTLVVMAGDHGESLGEHGERTHGVFIYDATMHVPLLMRHPGRLGRGRTVRSLVSLVDVVPTVLDLLEVPRHDLAPHGETLVPLLAGEQAEPHTAWLESWLPRLNYGWSELSAVRDLEWKYVRAPRAELYHISNDPREQNNLVARELATVEAYRERLQRMERSIEPEGGRNLSRTQEIDEELRKSLQALGYVFVVEPGAEVEGPRPDPKDKIGEYEEMARALAFMRKDREEEAIPILMRAIEANPQSGFLVRQLGHAYRRLGRLRDAIRELEKSLKIDPNSFGTLTDLGSAYFEAGEVGRAEGIFRQVLKINEHVAVAHFNLGLIEQTRDHTLEAIGFYERALQDDPNLLRGLVNLATLYETVDRGAEAIELYLRAAELDPENDKLFFSAAYVLFESGGYERALAVLDRAQQAHPQSPKPALYKARVYEKRGDLEAAERELRAALALDPSSAEARRHLDAIARRRGGS